MLLIRNALRNSSILAYSLLKLTLDNIKEHALVKNALKSLSIILLFSCCVFADDLQWGGTWAGVWSGFGTGPYTAIDQSKNNKVLVIFCLDYNDEIAPPYAWQANIRPVTQSNVDQYAQF